jgi:branched-chain amino acid transport system ATP-binding protein
MSKTKDVKHENGVAKVETGGPILKVSNLEVNYGGILALKGLSFEVKKGEIVSLIGANGAGKTTTLRAISALVPFTGSVEFKAKSGENTDLAKVPQHQIVKLGLAHSPEGRGIFPNLTVLENLQMGSYTRTDKEEIAKDLEHCFKFFPRLKERLKQKAGTLSGGEQQMLAMSRALMAKPSLLLLDEPSLGLAPLIVAQIFEIIKEVNKEGVTILLVEQNARMALKISSRAYVVETGKITLSGKGSDLLNDPRIAASYLGG